MAKDKAKKGDRKKKAGKKASQFAIRVETSERDDFVALCERLDTSAAREIRRFMRDFVARHGGGNAPAVAEESAPPETPAPLAPEPAAATATGARKPRAPRAKPETGSEEMPAARVRKPRTPRAAAATGVDPKPGAPKSSSSATASEPSILAPPRRPRTSKTGVAPVTKRRGPGRPPKPAE